MVELRSYTCTSCGANLQVSSDLTECICQYCGSHIYIYNEYAEKAKYAFKTSYNSEIGRLKGLEDYNRHKDFIKKLKANYSKELNELQYNKFHSLFIFLIVLGYPIIWFQPMNLFLGLSLLGVKLSFGDLSNLNNKINGLAFIFYILILLVTYYCKINLAYNNNFILRDSFILEHKFTLSYEEYKDILGKYCPSIDECKNLINNISNYEEDYFTLDLCMKLRHRYKISKVFSIIFLFTSFIIFSFLAIIFIIGKQYVSHQDFIFVFELLCCFIYDCIVCLIFLILFGIKSLVRIEKDIKTVTEAYNTYNLLNVSLIFLLLFVPFIVSVPIAILSFILQMQNNHYYNNIKKKV